MNNITTKPWGSYQEIYESIDTKVKIIKVTPQEAPSYQYHFKRSENWIIIKGSGILKLDGEEIFIKKGDSIFIKKEAKHQVKNTGEEDLVFVEVQLGEYFGEDDIIRIEDNYGRI